MALLMKSKPVELTAVEADPAVERARERVGDLAAEDRTLETEQRHLTALLDPNRNSTGDPRPVLTTSESIRARDRVTEIAQRRRVLVGLREEAADALTYARGQAYRARLADCQAIVQAKRERFWIAMAAAGEAQKGLDEECDRMNSLLARQAFAGQGWPGLPEQAEFRRQNQPGT